MPRPNRFKYNNKIDNTIQTLVDKYGKKWRLISNELGNVISDDAIRNRYMRLLGVAPKHTISNSMRPRKYWSEVEDEKLALAVQRHGMSWCEIQKKYFPQKTSQALRNRIYRMGDKFLFLITVCS
jgi:hypothetical protein